MRGRQSLGGIDSGCKWPGKANQWYTSHHIIGEDAGEGRMHARWKRVFKPSEQNEFIAGKSIRSESTVR